jgi:hypothetical protein
MEDTAQGSKARLDFTYDFKKNEFVLSFQSKSYASAYQSRNPEARILKERPYDAWIPKPENVAGLRSSSLGMAVVFPTEEAAQRWRERTLLGDVVSWDVDRSVYGVYFNREWDKNKIEKILKSRDSWDANPQQSSLRGQRGTRPNSRQDRHNSNPFKIVVDRQRTSKD